MVRSCCSWRRLYVFPEFDAQVIFTKIGVLLSYLLHGFLFCFLHVLLVSFMLVVVRRTFASQARGAGGGRTIPEMQVFLLGDVFPAVITYCAAAGTHDLIASAVFEDGGFAFRALTKDGLCASLLDLVAFTHAILFLEFFAAEGDVSYVSAFAAADFLALGVAAAELPVDFDGWTDGGEVAKGAGFEVWEVCFAKFRLLLETFELLYGLRIKEALSFLATEGLFAATTIHAHQDIAGEPDLSIRVCGSTVEAERVRFISAAEGDFVNEDIITETAGTFHDLTAVTESLFLGRFGISCSLLDLTLRL